MSAESGFLKAIVHEPDEDAHRLIYADWLEENGNPERAEFIRVQCELAMLNEDTMHRRKLAFRSRELLEQHEEEWAGPLREHFWLFSFHRGFVDTISIHDEDLYDPAKELFSLYPLRRLAILETADSMSFLSEVIPAEHHLTGLDLSYSEGELQHVAQVPHLGRLKNLNLMFCHLEDSDAELLCQGEIFQKMSLLRLGSNHFTNKGREMLVSHFGECVSFRCERDRDCLYPFDEVNFTTGFGNDFTQLLLWPDKAAIFDHAGNLLETRYRNNPDESMEQWKQELGFEPRGIKVKKMQFRDGTGIGDFPGWHENNFEPTTGDLMGEVREHLEEGGFVYVNGADPDEDCFWMNGAT